MKETNSVESATKMTSLQIAEITGKQHKDVLRAIRNMEPAWEKTLGRKFALQYKINKLATGGEVEQPYYSLTKTECLYIATKFNDEARARLILRWEELETSRPDHSELVLRLARSLYAANKMIASLHEAFSMEHEASLIILNGVRGGDSTQCKLDFIIKCVWQLVGYYLDPIDTERKMDQSRLREIIDSLSEGKEVRDDEDSLPF